MYGFVCPVLKNEKCCLFDYQKFEHSRLGCNGRSRARVLGDRAPSLLSGQTKAFMAKKNYFLERVPLLFFILALQNPEFEILESQNPEFEILEGPKS